MSKKIKTGISIVMLDFNTEGVKLPTIVKIKKLRLKSWLLNMWKRIPQEKRNWILIRFSAVQRYFGESPSGRCPKN